jgi:2-polyprenyl-3-methyl-5-hydroxy-6-metoxy-1,4-benzoquinol methylase
MLSQSIVGHGTNREVNDFYPTSPEYTEALLAVHKFHGSIWEPACGAGDMSQVLEEHGYTVYSSDLYSRVRMGKRISG